MVDVFTNAGMTAFGGRAFLHSVAAALLTGTCAKRRAPHSRSRNDRQRRGVLAIVKELVNAQKECVRAESTLILVPRRADPVLAKDLLQ